MSLPSDKKILAEQRISRLGWKRDLPDHRDHKHEPAGQVALPPRVDLRPWMPPAYDQLELGSCTSNAVAGLAQFLMRKRWKNAAASFVPSRLFLYYNQRLIEGTVAADAGSSLRSAMKIAQSVGCPHEDFWSYDVAKYGLRPSGPTYYDAKFHKLQSYQSVAQDHDAICSVLASGYPVAFGMTAFQGLEAPQVASSGVIPMPADGDEIIGGHAMVLAGYDEATGLFLVRNSWGTQWGVGGYATMPYDYVLNADLADDFWTAQMVY